MGVKTEHYFRSMIKNLFQILFCLLMFQACEPPELTQKSNNDFPVSFDNEITILDSLKPTVIKSLGDSVQLKTNEINWKEELSFFSEFEQLYPKHFSDYSKEEYAISDEVTDEYLYSVVEYTSKDQELPITKAFYYSRDSVCFKVEFKRRTDKAMIESDQTLIYEPQKGYSIKGNQSIGGFNELNYTIMGSFLPKKMWTAILNIGEAALPFTFSYENGAMTIFNAEEQIQVNETQQKGDTTIFFLPYFNSAIKVKITEENMNGNWYNYDKGSDYIIPFYATISDDRFDISSSKSSNLNGKWEVMFSPNTEDQYPAIGVFKQNGNYVAGTFITETGDYRFLEGVVDGNEMKLSCFDGSHAFLFTASLNENNELSGKFYSGNHWSEPWSAKRNDKFTLSNPYTLTHLTTADSTFSISFPNLDSVMVSLQDNKYQNKSVIIQVMGSWCPNCMDETNLMKELYADYNEKGLEVVSLCFERSKEFSANKKVLEKIKKDLNIPYEMLIAGRASKEEAAKSLPMLDHIMSYPTTIYLNKDKKVQRIHTGFYGPSTGEYYDNFVAETRKFIETNLLLH